MDPPFPPGYSVIDLYSIIVFSENDIWLADRGYVITKWDGENNKGINYPYAPSSVQSLWGTNPNNIFGAGSWGSFVYYNGTSWTKFDSLTSTTMTDIYGTEDGNEVWATGWDFDGKGAILKWTANSFEKIFDNKNRKPTDVFGSMQSSLWIGKSKIYFTGTNGFLYFLHRRKNYVSIGNLFMNKFPHGIRGSNENNIFIAGNDGMLFHWNGSTWYRYDQFSNPADVLYGVAVSKNLIVAGGRSNNSGLIIIGKK